MEPFLIDAQVHEHLADVLHEGARAAEVEVGVGVGVDHGSQGVEGQAAWGHVGGGRVALGVEGVVPDEKEDFFLQRYIRNNSSSG